ncbi:MAG: DUF3463 domain-containing protein [Verrucomicrobia bacterium]|nr:DUF3463 domain-containing protein [Verrucomicrobiota bacterium]
MRFPLPLSLKIAGHILKNRLRGNKQFAMVLQLEPLHACNLSCPGCGRIREYSTSLKEIVPLDRCLEAAAECDAPMVSICGGEPLIYPYIEELVQGLRKQGRIVYICTNGLLMRRKIADYLASAYTQEMEPRLKSWIAEGLLTETQAAEIRKGRSGPKPVVAPSKWIYWNVHLDGLERNHDASVNRRGVFREALKAVRLAKAAGYQAATNTTVYRETDMAEVEAMLRHFAALGVDGHTISPGYDFDSAKQAMLQQQGKDPAEYFLTRRMVREKFAHIREWGRRYNIFGTPVYQEFLEGLRELSCTAWAIPTFNIRGWRSPCYLLADTHYRSYRELLEKTDWERYGVADGKARDPRCENCMTHCGYDPSGALSSKPADIWKNLRYNFGPRPKPSPEWLRINPLNAGQSLEEPGRSRSGGPACRCAGPATPAEPEEAAPTTTAKSSPNAKDAG